jgi:hypothetical protein
MQGPLTYNCLCSNGSAPDLADYVDSMPQRICTKSYDLCIAAHPNDQLGQDGCTNNIRAKCGTLSIQNFTAAASTSSSASASATASGTGGAGGASASTTAAGSASGTASGSAASASASKASAAQAAMVIGKEYGTGIIAAGVVAFFGFML